MLLCALIFVKNDCFALQKLVRIKQHIGERKSAFIDAIKSSLMSNYPPDFMRMRVHESFRQQQNTNSQKLVALRVNLFRLESNVFIRGISCH